MSGSIGHPFNWGVVFIGGGSLKCVGGGGQQLIACCCTLDLGSVRSPLLLCVVAAAAVAAVAAVTLAVGLQCSPCNASLIKHQIAAECVRVHVWGSEPCLDSQPSQQLHSVCCDLLLEYY